MSGVLLSFTAMAPSIRALSKTLSIFEILSIRTATGLVVLSALALARPQLRLQLNTRQLWLQATRNVLSFSGGFAWSLALTLLPFATVFALEFTTPAWVALFAVLILGERMTASRIGVVVLGLAGIVLITRPGVEGFQPASLLVLAAAVAFAGSAICTKKLISSQTVFAILFWMNVMQLPMNLAGSDLLFVRKLGSGDLLPVIIIGVSGLTSHLCLTNAFRYGDATVVYPLDFLRLPLIALIGWWFYSEALDPMVFAGAALIIAGVLWNLHDAARGK
ncbi:MAG: DMT family transporter [Hyphomicrobiales bacterium]|nr:DMT family transporter [Hyphomicrobiales bacterium]MBV8825337.1 DMT family transporter [Hyphomicrobiales bacterium]MBV9429732.1 DMT family transporter [Bradyrhizobiaceae bacterium]